MEYRKDDLESIEGGHLKESRAMSTKTKSNTREFPISGVISVGDQGGPLEPVLTCDDEICPYLVLRTDRAKHLAGLQAVLKDLGHVQRALAILIKNAEADDDEQQIVNQCLWFSAGITYGKCFKSGSGRSVTLNESKDLRGLTADEEALHRETIQTRDQYIAHAGETHAEAAVIYAFLHPDTTKKGIVAVAPFSLAEMRIPPAKLVATYGLVEKVIRNVTESRKKASDAVRKEAEEEPIDDLYKRSRLPNTDNLLGVEQRLTDPSTGASDTSAEG